MGNMMPEELRELTAEDIIEATSIDVSANVCRSCGGSGWKRSDVMNIEPLMCGRCQGTGKEQGKPL